MITAVIPTYRRPDLARQALSSLQEQTLADFEILLVDNAADPSLRDMVAAFNTTARRPARYLPEERLGLHNARHAAVRAASGDLLVFSDDDATFDPGWLAAHQAAFDAHPEMAAAGGPVRPVWDAPPPAWLLDFMRLTPAMFPVLSLMEPYDDFRLAPDGYFFGVNMAVRKQVVLDVGGFNPDSFGDIWLGDGESGFNRKLWERGLQVGYVADAVVHHHVPPERMSLAYFRRRQANDGAADMYARYHAAMPGPAGLLRDAAAIAAASARDWAAAMVLAGRTDPRSLRVQMRAARSQAQVQYVLRLLRSPRLRSLVARTDWLHGR